MFRMQYSVSQAIYFSFLIFNFHKYEAYKRGTDGSVRKAVGHTG